MAQVGIPETPSLGWARNTGPDVSSTARRLLVHLAGLADPGTGAVSLTKAEIARGLGETRPWVIRNVDELTLAGLLLVGKDPDGGRRRNLYTLEGVESSSIVSIPLIPYSRPGFYLLHRRIIEFNRLLYADPAETRERRLQPWSEPGPPSCNRAA